MSFEPYELGNHTKAFTTAPITHACIQDVNYLTLTNILLHFKPKYWQLSAVSFEPYEMENHTKALTTAPLALVCMP